MMQYLTDNPKDAQLHIINFRYVNHKNLESHLSAFENTFTHILAFRLSRSEKKNTKSVVGNVTLIGLNHGEHCSREELERFVSVVKPMKVLSTVPEANNPNITPIVPHHCKYSSCHYLKKI